MSKICDLEVYLRPREKALANGISSLSDKELLAIVIRCGIKGTSALELADSIISEYGNLYSLLKTDIYSLMNIKGIKKAKAIELGAVIELMKRVSKENNNYFIPIKTSKDAYMLVRNELEHETQEKFMVLYLNAKLNIIKKEVVFVGGDSQSIVDINLLLKKAIIYGAKKILCIHNHPSGDITPSQEDIRLTIKIKQSAEYFNIKLVDHLIIGKNNFFSFCEHADTVNLRIN